MDPYSEKGEHRACSLGDARPREQRDTGVANGEYPGRNRLTDGEPHVMASRLIAPLDRIHPRQGVAAWLVSSPSPRSIFLENSAPRFLYLNRSHLSPIEDSEFSVAAQFFHNQLVLRYHRETYFVLFSNFLTPIRIGIVFCSSDWHKHKLTGGAFYLLKWYFQAKVRSTNEFRWTKRFPSDNFPCRKAVFSWSVGFWDGFGVFPRSIMCQPYACAGMRHAMPV